MCPVPNVPAGPRMWPLFPWRRTTRTKPAFAAVHASCAAHCGEKGTALRVGLYAGPLSASHRAQAAGDYFRIRWKHDGWNAGLVPSALLPDRILRRPIFTPGHWRGGPAIVRPVRVADGIGQPSQSIVRQASSMRIKRPVHLSEARKAGEAGRPCDLRVRPDLYMILGGRGSMLSPVRSLDHSEPGVGCDFALVSSISLMPSRFRAKSSLALVGLNCIFAAGIFDVGFDRW